MTNVLRKPITIQVIDDSEADRNLYKHYLNQEIGNDKYILLESKNGFDGVNHYKDNKPDCVLIDYKLPDTDGIEVLSSLRKIDSNVPAVIITGQGNEAIAVEVMKEGAKVSIRI